MCYNHGTCQKEEKLSYNQQYVVLAKLYDKLLTFAIKLKHEIACYTMTDDNGIGSQVNY